MEAQQIDYGERRRVSDRRTRFRESSDRRLASRHQHESVQQRSAESIQQRSARLSVSEVTTAIREIARELDPNLVVLGTVGARAQSNYIEIVLGLQDCHFDPCRITIGLTGARSTEDLRSAVEPAIREYLRLRRSARPH